MTSADDLGRYVAAWHEAIDAFVALARSIPEEAWDAPTDLPGWSVKDNVAHVAHLEAVLAGAPEETMDVVEAPHLTGPMNVYTEQGVLARRDRDVEALCTEIEEAAAKRYAELQAAPPTDPTAPAARTPAGMPWDVQTLLSNRVVDVFMHEQDIRRAIDRPGGLDSDAAALTLERFGAGLPMVVGKRLAPPARTVIRLEVPDADRRWTVRVGEDGRAVPTSEAAPSTATVSLDRADFLVLAGGRRSPDRTRPTVSGDEDLAHRLLRVLALTP